MNHAHCSFHDGHLPVDIFLLHGYKSNVGRVSRVARHFNKLGFNVTCCEYVGHGKRKKEGDNKLWFDTMLEIEAMIEESNKKVVLIGLSMGGALALSIGARMNRVDQVFAVSAPHGNVEVNSRDKRRMERIFNEKFNKENSKQMFKSMPFNFERCEIANKDKFFLVHCKNDTIVPFTEFIHNAEALCLPEANTFVYGKISGSGMLDHVLAQYHPRTMQFIEENIIEC